MSQTISSASFLGQNAQGAKSVDYAFVIAGWPTIYTIAKSYSIPSSGDLSTSNGFIGPTQAWASVPDSVGMGTKGRPEEGACTIAQVDIDVLDRVAAGTRAISDLISRQSYLAAEAANPQTWTYLKSDLSNGAATVHVGDVSTWPTSGIAFVGLECLTYAGTQNLGDGTWNLTGCTRGYRLTSPMTHVGQVTDPTSLTVTSPGARVYNNASSTTSNTLMPSIYRRRAFIYKGYQSLPLDQWQPAFGGCIGGVKRFGAKVTFSLYDTTWQAYANGEQVVLSGDPLLGRWHFKSLSLANDTLAGDFNSVAVTVDDPTNLDNGHYLFNIAGHWAAVTPGT